MAYSLLAFFLIPVIFDKAYIIFPADSKVRDLGPGSFAGKGNLLDQSGDIKLDASIEYRSKLFWKFQGAVFIDAGNIWTVREYANQPGGVFKFNKFYKQIAVAYGLGLRLDLDFFILRFDGGMKAVNPAFETKKEHFPIIHPKFSRDFAFHFAVGYPFNYPVAEEWSTPSSLSYLSFLASNIQQNHLDQLKTQGAAKASIITSGECYY